MTDENVNATQQEQTTQTPPIKCGRGRPKGSTKAASILAEYFGKLPLSAQTKIMKDAKLRRIVLKELK
jgi:hypothetical protein